MENKFKQEEEERYAFRVIDAFSRFAYFPFIKSNNSEDVLKAWKEEFNRNGGSHGNIDRDEETKKFGRSWKGFSQYCWETNTHD